MIGRRITQYCGLIDDIVDQLVRSGIGNTKGLRKTAMSGRWGQYLYIRGNGCFLHFCARAWARHRETPLWLRVKDHNWKTTAELRTALDPLEREVPPRLITDHEGLLLVPLFLPTGAERDAVLADLLVQILEVAQLFPDHTSQPASDQTADLDAADSSESGGSQRGGEG